MNKLVSAILAGVFTATLGMSAFAADEAAPAAEMTKEKPTAVVKKAKHHAHKKATKKAVEVAPAAK